MNECIDNDGPSGKGHMASEAFEGLDIGVCLLIVSIKEMIDGTTRLETDELECDVRGARPS